MKLVLEARHLFDGSLHAVAKHATDVADHTHSHPPADAHAAPSHTDPGPAAHAAVSYADVPALAPNPTASEILFVDTRVANWQSLASSVKSDVQVVLIDPAKDGIDQVTAALQGRSGLTSIQFLTYGQPGQLELGSSAVTTASLSSHAGEVASWGDHLAAGGDIEFWGCDVGQGSTGQAFVDTVHTLTGATVGASTDVTGAATLGGNWVLEDTTGPLHGAVFSDAAMADYQGVLDTANPIVTLTAGTGSLTQTDTSGKVLAGDTFSETLTFVNGATTSAGFGPIVGLYAPTASSDAETAMLTSATYLGQPVSFTAIQLTQNPDTHPGYLSPHVLTNGLPTFVDAPAGYKVGDTVYELVLPFGSYTPGEPAASIKLTFKMDATGAGASELTSVSHQTLDITAVPYFEFGASATGSTSISGAAVVSNTTVIPLDVTEQAVLHENETATGPDNPFVYEINVIVAPDITAADPINNLDMTFTLPDSVQRVSGSAITVTLPSGVTATVTPTDNNTASPGDTVTVDFPTLSSSGPLLANTKTVIDIPVFVPDKDAGGNTILTSAVDGNVNVNGQTIVGTGQAYQKTLAVDPAFNYTGTWTPNSGLDSGTPVNIGFADTAPLVKFVAKALAIQVTDNAGGSAGIVGAIAPGQTGITETIHFQVSDYFNLNNLVIQNVIGDGFLLDSTDANGLSATLQVQNANSGHAGASVGAAGNLGTLASAPIAGGATVSTVDTGSNTLWTATANTDGTTTMQFMVGTLLADIAGGSVLQGGSGGSTQGTITFKVNAQNTYSAGGSNAGRYLLEGDPVTDGVTTAGTSATVAAGTLLDTGVAIGGSVSDDSSLTDVVPANSLVLEIADVNGQPPSVVNGTLDASGNVLIQPGDTVTYQLVYTLTASDDFGNATNGLTLSAFLPLPIFDAGSLTLTSGTPGAGQFSVVSSNGSINTYFTGNHPSATFDPTANNVTFSLGNHDDPANLANQTITVAFTVTAQNKAFANNLFLTNLASSSDFDAHNVNALIPANAIQQVKLQEPELETKTGVVSVIGDSGATKGSYSADTSNSSAPWTAQSGTPATQFAPAGTAVGNPFGSGDPQTSDNMNVTGADAGDHVRIVSTVKNNGNATAFDVTVNGTLPGSYTASNVTNFAVYDASGAQLGFTGSIANYFSPTGITLTNGVTAGQAVYVVYDLTLLASQSVGTTLTVASSAVNWANVAGGVAAGNGFVTAGTPVGENPANLADNATIGIPAPSIAKTVIASGENANGDVPLGSNNDVVQGDVVTYQITVTVPEGTTSNNGGDVTITDVLPAGMTYVGLTVTGTGTNGVTSSLGTNFTSSYNAATNTVIFDIGVLTNSQADRTGTVTIQYQVQVSSTLTPPSTGNTTFENTATLTFNGNQTVQASATATEVDPHVTETITVSDGGTTIPANGTVFDGENLTYTVALKNDGGAQADQLTYFVEVPTADLVSIAAAATNISGAQIVVLSTHPIAGETLVEITVPTLAVGATDNFSFTATVNQNLPADTHIVVDTPSGNALTSGGAPNGTYNSLPDNSGHVFSGTVTSTVSIDTIKANLGIIGEANNTSGNGTGLFTATGTVPGTPVDATIGDLIRYSAYAQLPAGQQSDLKLTVNLPAGMQFLNDSTITIELVSPNNPSSISATIGGVSVDGPGVSYTSTFDPTVAIATFALPASQITVNPDGTVTFDLGQVTDNQHLGQPDFAIVQFTAIVANQASNVGHTPLPANAAIGSDTSHGPASANATVDVVEPHVTLSKGVTSIVTVGGITTVTYTETVTNIGDATAYNVSLNDPEAVANVGAINVTSQTGTLTLGGTGTDLTTTGSLAAGMSEVITYTQTVTTPSLGVADTIAKVTYTSLSTLSAVETSTVGSTTDASGTVHGSRDGTTAPLSVNDYETQVTLGLGAVSGQVWNDIGPTNSTFGETGSHDTALGNVTVSATFAGTGGNVTETVTTVSTAGPGLGTYTILAPDGGVTITLPTPGTAGGVPANETLVYNDGGVVTGGATHTSTASSATPLTNVNFSYQTPDTAPTISTWGGGFASTTPSVTYTEGGAAVVLSGGASIADTEIDETSQNYSGSKLTVERYSAANTKAANGADLFVGTGTGSSALVLSVGSVTYGGTSVGTYTQSGGVLTITFTATTVTAATVNGVLNAIGYQGTDTDGFANEIKIGATLDDHNNTGLQGTGGNKTSAPVFVTLNEVPTLAGASFTDPNNTPAPGSPTTLFGTVAATGSDTFGSVTVQITSGYVGSEDVLEATNGSLPTGVNASVVGSTLTFTKSGGLSASDVQAALRTVQYYDNSDTPITASRTVTVTLNDTTTGGTLVATQALSVIAENDSPTLSVNPSLTLPAQTENVTTQGAPTGAVGTVITDLTGGIADTDANNQFPGTLVASQPIGIAITEADSAGGTWYYSTDSGANWTAFTATAGSGTALHLVANNSTRVFFQPNAGVNGVIDDGLTFVAWDQNDGASIGLSAIPTSGLGTGNDSSARTAYSATAQIVPLVINASVAGATSYTDPNTDPLGTNLSSSAVVVDPSLIVEGSHTFNSATVAITNYVAGEDVLTASASGFTVAFDTTNGILTLTKAGATAAELQAELRSVSYYDSSDTPTTGNRSFTIAAADAVTTTNRTLSTPTLTVIAANDSPVLHGHPVTLDPATENQVGIPTSGTVGTQISSLIGGGNVTDTDGANAHDGSAPGALGIAVTAADTSEGNWWFSTDGGLHWTEFAGTGTTETALNGANALHLASNVVGGVDQTQIYFQPTVTNANGLIANALTFRAWDQFDSIADHTVVSGAVTTLPTDTAFGTGTNSQASAYSSAVQTLPITITSTGAASYTEVNGADTGSAAVIVDHTAVLTATTDTFTSATVSITNFQSEDRLVFVNANGVTGSYDNSTGVLTLTSSGATAAVMQAAIDSVTYYDSSDTPVTTTRTVAISAHDSSAGTDVAVASTTITVIPTNDSPVLDSSVSVSLNHATEDAGAPVDRTAVGTLVSQLVGGITDGDANGVHDGATPATVGIAITAADTSEGSWYYSTDGGAHWTLFASAGSGLPTGNALHLVADANTRIYFDPTANWNGSVPNALTFRAWDQFDHSIDTTIVNGSVSALPTGLGSGANTAGSAYSSATKSIDLVADAVNDAPVASGSATVAATEDTTPPGDTVAHLFGGNFNDGTDQQHTVGNPTGSVANTLAGIAITGNAATADQGVWQYSTDNGTTWTAVSTSVSDTSALVLSQSAELRFLPDANFNGVPGGLTTRLIDSSTQTVTTGVTGASLVGDTTAHAGVDVSGTNDGGTTAVSAGTVVLDTSVVAVNDAPTVSGSATLASTPEDTTSPAGATVTSLLGQGTVIYSDATDTVTTAVSGGSTGTPAAAIAITGNASTAAQGHWDYSTDNGVTWTTIPTTGLSDTNAIVIPGSAELRFVPVTNFNGVPGGLTAHVSDGTALPATGAQDISATEGGTGGWSTGTIVLGTSVIAVNDAPVASGGSALLATTEDTSNPPGDTVAHLFGGNFNDSADTVTTAVSGGSSANTLAGVAITGNAATAGQGVWQYSTDNGTTWTAVSTSVSDTSALVLSQSAELRFVPDANFNGVPGALTTRLIDSSTVTVTTGVTGLDLSTGNTVFTGVDVSGTNDGGTTAVSAATVALNTSVIAVNDAPVASGSATVPSTPEDSNPAGTSVGSLLGQTTVHYSDATDTVTTAVSGGSVGTPAAAIAITGNAATPDQGTWQYSTDNGTTWISIPASGLGDANAVVIPGTAELRFVPVANFNGVPGELTAHVSDGTNLPAAGTTDISTTEGGTGGWSAGTITLGTSVVAVNDAPVVGGSATVPSTPEDSNPAGTSVGSLLGQTTVHYSDATDTVTTAVSGGSVGTPAAAIAITGNAATPDQGTWQYSTDNGTTWVSIPATGLSDSNAVVIPTSAELRFVPTGNYNGAVGSLTAHVSDGTDLPATGAHDISTTEGGTGGWSAGTITLGTSVTAVNDAPVASGSASLPGVSQDELNIPGDTVAHLFGGNFDDSADQQQTTANPTGSTANSLAGIAITGNAAAGQGTWEYSSDGVNWIAVPTNVSDSNAILVPSSGSIRFLPNLTFHGTPGGLTVHLIDSSSGALAGISTGVDVSNDGGTTAFSAAPVVLTTSVTQGGGRAVLTPPATVDPSLSTSDTSNSTTIADKPSPGDFGLSGGNHGSTTDDFLQRPIIPQVSLIGSVGNKFVLAEQQAIIAIPENLFEDTYPGAQLEYDARNPAGGALPSWLEFDARNLTFTGTPPASAHGAVDILIVARDQFGNEATASFRILVGRESEDLQHLLEPNSPPPSNDGLTVGAPPASNGNQPAPANQTAPANGATPGRRTHTDVVPHDRHADLGHAHGGTVEGMFASLAQPANGVRHGHSAFSAQLREAGPIGRLSQARQLLETIAKTVSSKPAA